MTKTATSHKLQATSFSQAPLLKGVFSSWKRTTTKPSNFTNFKNFLVKATILVLLFQLLPTNFILVPQTQAAGIDSNTVLMLHNDGDASGTNKSFTVYGNPQITDTSKFSKSGHFDGNGDYLSIPDSSDWDFGTGAFTIDTWVKVATNPVAYNTIFDNRDSSNGYRGWVLNINSSGNLFGGMQNGGGITKFITSTSVVSNNKWHHVALSRSTEGNLYMFVDGVLEATATGANNNYDNSEDLQIGIDDNNGNYLNGYLDDLRVTKGDALWTSNFTPPTSAVTAGANTKLLLHMDGTEGSTTFTDSANSKTVTVSGNTHITGIAEDFGSAISFDGTGDYLSVPDSDDWDFGTGNFTVDFNLRFSSVASQQLLFWVRNDANTGPEFWSHYNPADNTLNFHDGVVNHSRSWTPLANTWYHLAIVRSSQTMHMYVNWQEIGSGSSSTAVISSSTPFIGGWASWGWSYEFMGDMDEFRVSNNARWTSNFSPSGSIYTTDANTKLLLHFDGDQSASGHPISFNWDADMNASGKFSGSYYFDGDGDYLSIPDSEDWSFDANFTVDFWLNRAGSFGSKMLITNHVFPYAYPDQWGWWLRFQSDNTLLFGWDNGTVNIWNLTTTQTIADSNWHHIAVVRSGSKITIYIDGINRGETSTSTNIVNGTINLRMGLNNNNEMPYTGYLDEIRISKGIARWTSDFSANLPTSAYNTLVTNTAPNNPTLDNYNDGANTADNTPTLQFDLSDPDAGDLIKYQIQIDNNSNFLSPEVNVTEGSYSATPRSNVTYTPSALADGQWYWRVKAIDDEALESAWTTASN